jgi:tRNA(His) 5'-end guanylyltransferase
MAAAGAEPLPVYDARVTPGAWTILRLDGRRFTTGSAAYRPPLELIAQKGIIQPFHPSFHDAMRAATQALMELIPADYAHTASDEISLVIPPAQADFYAGRLSKWLSVAAGGASVVLGRSLHLFQGLPIMDARAFSAATPADVEAYLRDRTSSAWRNCRNAYVWHAIAAQGHTSPREIEQIAHDLGQQGRTKLLNSIPNHPPAWERHGSFLIYAYEKRTGVNPLTGKEKSVERQVLDWVQVERLDADLSAIMASHRVRNR